MKKVLIIGNSHLGAVKLGWDEEHLKYPDVKIDFWGLPGKHFLFADLLQNHEFGLPDNREISTRTREICN